MSLAIGLPITKTRKKGEEKVLVITRCRRVKVVNSQSCPFYASQSLNIMKTLALNAKSVAVFKNKHNILLSSRDFHKVPSPNTFQKFLFLVMIMVVPSFTLGKAHWWKTSPKCVAQDVILVWEYLQPWDLTLH
jgi:hypothetical protein